MARFRIEGTIDSENGASARDFRDEDFPGLARLWSSTGVGNPDRGDTLESIARTLARGGRLLVREVAGAIVASAWLTDDGRRLHVHHMAVAPELQGRGYGRLLLEEAIAIAAEKGLQMKLEVHRDNARAIALYRSCGFDFIGEYRLMLRRRIGRTE